MNLLNYKAAIRKVRNQTCTILASMILRDGDGKATFHA